MRKIGTVLGLMALAMAAACVTVNIYFPAAEVRQDAERVVKQAYGIEEQGEKAAPAEGSSLAPRWLDQFGPATAHAQDYVNLNNAATRGLEQQVADVTRQLEPYFASGNVGIDSGGFAVLRDQSGLDMKAVATVNRLVAQDRSVKSALYKEKAKAAGTPDKAGEVQSIYAELWKKYAAPGTWIETGSGWKRK